MTTHAYCTYFDSGYLSRGLALIESLRANGDEAEVWIMALDDAVYDYFTQAGLENVTVISVSELEAAEPALATVKPERSRMEYYFTCTPLLIRFVMNRHETPTSVIYLDADMYFFDRPSLVLDAMGDGSVGIIEHRYPPRLEKRLAKYGRFNVGWVGFAADERGRDCLDWWAASTLEWCFDIPLDGKYADQGYLDAFPEKFDGVSILAPLGLDLAPWNSARFTLSLTQGAVHVDDDPLVFFHFHGLKRLRSWYITSQLVYGAWMTTILRDEVYVPYARRLEALDRVVAASPYVSATQTASRGKGFRGLLFRAQKSVIALLTVATGNAISVRRLDRP